jgi:hypothetical protein
MTIRLLAKHDKYTPNTIVTLDAATEAGLIAARLATADMAGGVPYVAPTIANQRYSISVEIDPNGRSIALVGGPGERRLSLNPNGLADSIMFLGSSSMARGSEMPHVPDLDPASNVNVTAGAINPNGIFLVGSKISWGTPRAAGGRLNYYANGTVEYQAPGDTSFGPRVAVSSAQIFYTLQSGNPAYQLYTGFISRFAPATDVAVTFGAPASEVQSLNNVSSWGIPGILQTLLSRPFGKAVTYAVGGTTLVDWVSAMPEWSGVQTDITLIYSGNDIVSRADVPSFLANMEAVIKARQAIGSAVVVGTILPANGRTALTTQAVIEANLGLKSLANRLGFILWDAWPYIAAADGSWASGMNADNLHANGDGATAIVERAIMPAMRHLVSEASADIAASIAYDPVTSPFGNLVPNPSLTGTNGTKGSGVTGEVPTSWIANRNVGSTLTAVLTAPESAGAKALPDGRIGKYLTAVVSNANASAAQGESLRIYLQSGITNFIPGRVYEFTGEFTIQGAGIRTIEVLFSALGSGLPTIRAAAITPNYDGASAVPVGALGGKARTFRFRRRLRVPAIGYTSLNVAVGATFEIGGGATIDVPPTWAVREVAGL